MQYPYNIAEMIRLTAALALAFLVNATVCGGAMARRYRDLLFEPPPQVALPTYYNAGTQYCQHAEYAKAIPYLKRAVELHPKDTNAFYNLGIAYTGTRRYKEAIAAFEAVLKIDPHYIDAYINKGSCENRCGKRRQAVDDYTKAMSLTGSAKADLLYDRGSTLCLLKDYDKSIADLNELIAIDPKNHHGYYYRGFDYVGLNKPQEAIADFNSYIHICGGDKEALQARGDAYSSLGQYVNAVHDYSEALRFDPNFVEVLASRSLLYTRLGQSQLAIKDANEIIKQGHSKADGYGLRAFAQFAARDLNGARGDCDACKQITQNNYLQHFVSGMLEWRKNETDAALSELATSIRLKPGFDESYYNRGIILCSIEQYKNAQTDFEKALAIGPSSAGAKNNLGYAQMKQGQYQAAQAQFDQALQLDSKFAAAYSNRGFVRLQLGETAQAVEDCEKAVKLNPQLAEAHFHLGLAYDKFGSADMAAHEFAKAGELGDETDTSTRKLTGTNDTLK
jgi:tetratricopeptide (TPR) repeat protein